MMFDWITPLWTLVQDWRNRPAAGFTVRADTAWSAYAIGDLLAAHGIRTWGWRIVGDLILFRLRACQARYAEYLMDRHGVPWVGGAIEHSRRAAPKRKPRRHSSVLDFFQRF